MIKAFGRLRSARRVDDDKSSLPPIPGSSVQEKWENAISTVVSSLFTHTGTATGACEVV